MENYGNGLKAKDRSLELTSVAHQAALVGRRKLHGKGCGRIRQRHHDDPGDDDMKKKVREIEVLDTRVAISRMAEEDFISLTDIARHRDSERSDDRIRNWIRNRNTLEFLGIWEKIHNPDFNSVEFDGFRMQAGLNSFTLTPKQWIQRTGARGIVSKAGRYGGTFAHRDIAFEFASWISVEFKLYLIKEFQRLLEAEQGRLGWDIKRNLTKINYRIHTDAIKANLIPPELTGKQVNLVYASEADVLNWRTDRPGYDHGQADAAARGLYSPQGEGFPRHAATTAQPRRARAC
jgi:hypothetical protein